MGKGYFVIACLMLVVALSFGVYVWYVYQDFVLTH